MPICTHCTTPVPHLYTTLPSRTGLSTIRLTQCPSCRLFADKYVEHDYVVLFIDLVLVKKECLRHLLFNRGLVADDDDNGGSSNTSGERQRDRRKQRRRLGLDDSIWRLGVLLVLFDVYITWASIEKLDLNQPDGSDGPSILAEAWLPIQYLFFLTVKVLATLAQHFTVRTMAKLLLGERDLHRQNEAEGGSTSSKDHERTQSRARGQATSSRATSPYASTSGRSNSVSPNKNSTSRHNASASTGHGSGLQGLLNRSRFRPASGGAISTALLVSSCLKLFPILLVVWPTTGGEQHDSGSRGPLVNRTSSWIAYIVLLNNVEALQMLLDCGYVTSTLLAVSGALARGMIEGWSLNRVGLSVESLGPLFYIFSVINWIRDHM